MLAGAGRFARSGLNDDVDACETTEHIRAGQDFGHHAGTFDNRNKVCTWAARCDVGGLVTVTFTSFDLRIRGEDSGLTTAINFYDGVDASAPLLATLTGGDLIESQVASGRDMYANLRIHRLNRLPANHAVVRALQSSPRVFSNTSSRYVEYVQAGEVSMDNFLNEYEDHWLNQIPRCTVETLSNLAVCNNQIDIAAGPYMVSMPNLDESNLCGPENPDTVFCAPAV